MIQYLLVHAQADLALSSIGYRVPNPAVRQSTFLLSAMLLRGTVLQVAAVSCPALHTPP